MNYSLLESITNTGAEIEALAEGILASAQKLDGGDLVIESADSVLALLAKKLSDGTMNPNETNEFAQLYAGLSMLTQDSTRQAFKIDTKTQQGMQNFSRIVNGVGSDSSITAQVERVAAINGDSYYTSIKRDLDNFQSLDQAKKQQYLNGINKLRIGYERARQKLDAGQGGAAGNNQDAQSQNQGNKQEQQGQQKQQPDAQQQQTAQPVAKQSPAATPQATAAPAQ